MRTVILIFGVGWILCVGGGFVALGRYDAGRGTAAAAPAALPADAAQPASKPNLLVFLHPRCPCSRATVNELAGVLASCPDRANVRVVMMRPEGTGETFEQTPLRKLVARLPGVTIESDAGGELAKRFGAATSGQVLLYDAEGRLTFAGGITAARGHGGDNAGRRALVAALSTDPAATATLHPVQSDVFGCALFTPGSSPNVNDATR